MPEFQDPKLRRMLRTGLPDDAMVDTSEKPLTINQANAYDKLARTSDLTCEVTEPSVDQVLSAMGYLSPSDKRSCCRDKQK